MNKHVLTYFQLGILCEVLALEIRSDYALAPLTKYKVFGVPRGGISAALALSGYMPIVLVQNPANADFIVDDLIDSGTTARRFEQGYPNKNFYALLSKQKTEWEGKWVVFPWEVSPAGGDESIKDNIVRLLQFVGEDPNRGGLLETPERVVRAWQDWCSGYHGDASKILKTFTDGAEHHDQMITVEDIPFYSHCEHHLAPFFGKVTISYIPNGKIVGLSKLSRLAGMFSKRLQVQERMTDQIADAINEHLEPVGVGVCVRARHLCMESRGVRQQGHQTITTALRGAIKDEPSARAEFLQLAR